MRLNFRLLATVCAFSAPATALALDMPSAYIGGAGGWNIVSKEDITSGAGLRSDFKNGWAALGTVGARFDYGVRGELEVGYRSNKIKSIQGAPLAPRSGNGHTWTVMANGLYDFMNSTPFTPYLGIGVGGADVSYSNVRLSTTTVIDDAEWHPAIQGIVGASYKIMDNLGIFANYQYLTTNDLKMRSNNGLARVNDRYEANTFLLGVHYMFGAPQTVAQAAPEAPAPAPQQPVEQAPVRPSSYLVFFDWNKATLTTEGMEIVKTAADNARASNATHLDVTGHADRSGSTAYNMALSRRRAQTVKNELVRLGIPANEIAIFAKGESEPLVPTDDGVREPQNRRVEIIYSTQ
jgi:OOP family OmpA-OmpF porin